MRPRRLLVVSDEMEVGGSQRQIVHLLAGLDRERWQPELAYFRERSFLADHLSAQGIPVRHLHKRGRIDPVFLWQLAALLRDGRYDLVHAFSLTAEIWTLAARMLLPRPPRLVASVRGLYQEQSPMFWSLKRFVVRHADAIIANADAGARVTAGRTGLAIRRFRVVPNGVSMPPALAQEAIDAMRSGIGAPVARVLALYVGRLVPEKNIGCLLRALAALPPQARPWLALAGDGPMRAALARMAAELGIADDVHFLGERSDPVSLMQVADLLVLPSRQEGLSNVLLEAMAAGCPVVASAVGGTPELVVDGRTGLLFADDDAEALALCLRRLSTDAPLRATLAAQARQRASADYSVERLVAATTQVYEQCLGADSASAAAHSPPAAGG